MPRIALHGTKGQEPQHDIGLVLCRVRSRLRNLSKALDLSVPTYFLTFFVYVRGIMSTATTVAGFFALQLSWHHATLSSSEVELQESISN